MFTKDQIIKTTQGYLKVIDEEILNNIVKQRVFTENDVRDMIQKNILTFNI